MSPSCWKCGHPLSVNMLGGVQDCPSCRQVDAINKQTKLLSKQQSAQPTPSTPSNDSDDLFGTFLGISAAVTLLYWCWLGIVFVASFIADYKWWFVGLASVVIIFAFGNKSKQ